MIALGVTFGVLLSFQVYASDADSVKKAEWARLSGDPVAILKHTNAVQNSNLAFWKNTLLAEAYTLQGDFQKVAATLSDLQMQPAPLASLTDDGYNWLYKRALLASLNAKKSLGQSTTFENTQLRGFYPLDDSLLATLDESQPLSITQKVQKIKILSLNYAFKKAKGVLDANSIANSSLNESEKCAVALLNGRALKSFDDYATDAIGSLQLVQKSAHCDDDQKAKALFYLGNVGKNINDNTLMVASYETLAKDYASHYLADDALNVLANLYETSHPELSQKYYKKLDDSKMGDTRMEHFFEIGFTEYKNQNYSAALKNFAKVSETITPINETYVQGLYWQARTHEKIKPGKTTEAKAIYQHIIQDYPFSFYAVLAAKRLGTTMSMPHLPSLQGQAPASVKNEFALATEFNNLEYSQGARVMIDLAIVKNPELKKTDAEFLAKSFIEAQNYREAIELAATHFGSGPYGPVANLKDPLMTAFYPNIFTNEVSKGYQVSGLPQGAIEGISREESLFKKDATSWVGAKGLMQLMPSTARMIQGAVMAHTPTTELTNPLNNILLGSHYLKLMKQKFSGQMPLAIMAYNAGPGNVNKWLRKATTDKALQDLDMFIEEIPFSETKGYVKRVMRSMNVYGAMYNEDYFKKNRFSLNVQSSTDV